MPDPPPEFRRGKSLRNRSSGAWGEELALRYLTRQGYTLVERNYRTRYGELDLVVRRGTTLILVPEYKAPQAPSLVSALSSWETAPSG